MFLTGLKHCVEFLEKFRNWFELIWSYSEKVMKETGNRKREKNKEKKKLGHRIVAWPIQPAPRPCSPCAPAPAAASNKRHAAQQSQQPTPANLFSFLFLRAGPACHPYPLPVFLGDQLVYGNKKGPKNPWIQPDFVAPSPLKNLL
jgi:hypothetical protein